MAKIRLALFASGKGTNALRLIEHFKDHPLFEIAFLMSNRENAPILELAEAKGIEIVAMSNEQVENGVLMTEVCQNQGVDAIILAGYLRKIPLELIQHYQHKIINIHPALLPKYGGKGMYGTHVHAAVLKAKDKVSGISIHFVDEIYDEGPLIAQFYLAVKAEDTIESLAQSINNLELAYYPIVCENTLKHLYHV